jgi:ribA/ribD-fused uncharacterized protein
MSIKFCRLNEPYGEFSNFYPSKITIDGVDYNTVEHYYQSQKFEGTEWTEFVRKQKSPSKAKEAAWLPELKQYMRKDWNEVRIGKMATALYYKFQLQKFKNLLLSTGDEEIIEISKRDIFWGQNNNGIGENILGKMLMNLRQHIRLINQDKNKFFIQSKTT